MYTPDELHGFNAMMPAFTTEDATSMGAVDTVDVDNLTYAVNRMIDDGVNVISTTGSYGECSTLLFEEFQTLVTATLEVVRDRVPVFIGVTSQNGREVLRKARFAREAGAQGIFVGVPAYFVPTVENAIDFYRELGEWLPDMSIQIYHNPSLHRIHIPVAAFEEICKNRNVVFMKDSHRTTTEFLALEEVVKGRISIFVNQLQYYPYCELGAQGFWSTQCWMGPWPLIYLRDLVAAGEFEKAKAVTKDIAGGQSLGTSVDFLSQPQDSARKVAANYAGYCNQGPNRSPYNVITEESMTRAIRSAERWKALCEKYRPLVEGRSRVGAAS